MRFYAATFLLLLPFFTGCALVPEISYEPTYRNPFPQLQRVAVLPFFNQSREPTVNQDEVAIAYANELQKIPGFEVMPVGVAKRLIESSNLRIQKGSDFQALARFMGVDAVVVGSVTEYSAYYPPRLGLAVQWYAANPGFHPIPAGYGLPWGTAEEEFIPSRLVDAAEFELAKAQLKTQTPEIPPLVQGPMMEQEEHELPKPGKDAMAGRIQPVAHEGDASATPANGPSGVAINAPGQSILVKEKIAELPSIVQEVSPPPGGHLVPVPMMSEQMPIPAEIAGQANLPPDWPDPRGFQPPPPAPTRPTLLAQSEPILSQINLFDGADGKVTAALERYYYFRDDARFGGWQTYLQRSQDFTSFCCYQSITEMLAARGGAAETRVVYQWPISR